MGIKKVGKLGKGFPTVSVIRLCMTQIKSVQLILIINNRCINRGSFESLHKRGATGKDCGTDTAVAFKAAGALK